MDAITNDSYEEMPYPGYTMMETHPGRIAAIGRLHGLQAVDPTRSRILELGCGSGINLLAMAQAYPDAEFVGIDLAEAHIEEAKRAARETGFERRVTFLREDLAEIRSDLGKFDTIICHGVYSWVPREVRNSILDLCRKHLNPHGVTYVSYNCLPGWRSRGAVREMMMMHTEGISDMRQRVAKARHLIEFLAGIVPENVSYGSFLRKEAAYLASNDDAYIAHDYLSSINDPIYFRDFLKEISSHGLGYLDDANPWKMRADDLSPSSVRQLEQMAPDPVTRAQYLDFIRDRTFRNSLLCHAGVMRSHEALPEQLKGLQVRGRLRLRDPYKNGRALFITAAGVEITVQRPPVAALFTRLAALGSDDGNASLESDQLVSEVIASLGGGFDGVTGESAMLELKKILLNAFLRQLIDLTVAEPSPAGMPVPAVNPKALPLARWQAFQDGGVSAGDLGYVRPDDLLRSFIRLSDGTRNKDSLVDGLMKAFRKGEFSIQGREGPMRDAVQVKAILMSRYEAILKRLGELGVMTRG